MSTSHRTVTFGFASLLEQTPHQTTAIALEDAVCIEVSRDDIAPLKQVGGLGPSTDSLRVSIVEQGF